MDSIEERLCAAIDVMRGEIVGFLADMVRAESVNPPGDTAEVVEVICRVLRASGIEHEVVTAEERKPNVVARIGSKARPELLLCGHVDTVPAGDEKLWQFPPFSAHTVDGKLYGRGAIDDKGSVAAMVMAAKALAGVGVELQGTLVIAPVADEEAGGSAGARALVKRGVLRPDAVIIGEPTNNKIVFAEKGVVIFKVKCFGRSAHASTPEMGVNAISNMLLLLRGVEDQVGQRIVELSKENVLGPSLSIGTITGGTKSNVVPDYCEATIDRRLAPCEDIEGAKREIEGVIASLAARIPNFRAEVEVVISGLPFSTPENSPLVTVARKVCTELGLSADQTVFPGASDGKAFARLGVPIIILGPGETSAAHTTDEFMDLGSLVAGTKIYALTATRMLGRG